MLQAVGSQRDPTQRLSRSKVLAEEESRMLVPLRAAHGTQPEGLRVQSCCSRGRGVLPFSGWIVSGHFVYTLRRRWTLEWPPGCCDRGGANISLRPRVRLWCVTLKQLSRAKHPGEQDAPSALQGDRWVGKAPECRAGHRERRRGGPGGDPGPRLGSGAERPWTAAWTRVSRGGASHTAAR